MEAESDGQSKRDALRKAGQEYFSQALERASKGFDPFASKNAGTSGETQEADEGQEDADVATVGMVIEGSKYYVALLIFACCQGAGVVLLERCVRLFKTPFLVMFWHMLALVVVLWALSFKLQIRMFKWREVRTNLPSILLHTFQLLCLVTGVWLNTVFFVVSWISVSLLVIEVLLEAAVSAQKPTKHQQTGLTVGAVALGIHVLFGGGFSLSGSLVMVGWSFCQGGRLLLEVLNHSKQGPFVASDFLKTVDSYLGAVGGNDLLLQQLAANWSAADHMFYQHMIPAIPVLILGFITEEAYILAKHDVTVFQATCLLVSCLSYTLVHIASLLLWEKLQGQTAKAIWFTSHLGAIILEIAVAHGVPSSPLSVLAAIVVCGLAFIRKFHSQIMLMGVAQNKLEIDILEFP